MTKKELKLITNVAVLLVAALIYLVTKYLPHQAPVVNLPQAAAEQSGFFYVSRVIDGDTIKLSGGEHVRLIGIDTPESRYNKKLARDAAKSSKDINVILNMGEKASNFTKKLVAGKKVKLEYDVEKRDKYGRLLAYVYLDDGTFVNAKIIGEGYAQAMTIPPNVKYAGYFSGLQREAREKNKGLWKANSEKSLF